jgi:hypothetical protein
MKKLFVVFFMVASLVFAGNAFACEGEFCSGTGNFDLEVTPYNGGIDGALKTTYKGIALGGGLAGGIADNDSSANGFNFDSYGSIYSKAGGAVGAKSFEWWDFGPGYIEHGIGTKTNSIAVVQSDMYTTIDPGKFIAGAEAHGDFSGIAGQVTGNASLLGSAPIFENKGVTGGLAVQGSVGYIQGGYSIGAGPDFYRCWSLKDQYAGADLGAGVFMEGFSQSHSWRGVEKDGDMRTEFMGTRTIVETDIESYGYDHNWDGAGTFSDWSYSHVNGGFIAGGLAANGSNYCQ